jgi:RimJ/RimL family protein N-acetyltransferase
MPPETYPPRSASGAPSASGGDRLLRDVVESDLDAFYEQQRDPEATRMALFPARDRPAFDAHWRKVLTRRDATTKTIVYRGEVAGNALSWRQDDRQLVGYWLGREYWGKGLATRALGELVDLLGVRPLHAWVVPSNVASVRVLEKCGFVLVEKHVEQDERLGQELELHLYELP